MFKQTQSIATVIAVGLVCCASFAWGQQGGQGGGNSGGGFGGTSGGNQNFGGFGGSSGLGGLGNTGSGNSGTGSSGFGNSGAGGGGGDSGMTLSQGALGSNNTATGQTVTTNANGATFSNIQGFVGREGSTGGAGGTGGFGQAGGGRAMTQPFGTSGRNNLSSLFGGQFGSQFGLGSGNGFEAQRASVRAVLINRIDVPPREAGQVSTEISSRLARVPRLADFSERVQVSVTNGRAVITGSVSDVGDLDLLLRHLRLEPGIYQIDNQVTIGN